MIAGKALEAAEVGDYRHLGLADREDRVRARQSDIAGAYEVDAAPDAVAVHRGDHRLRAVSDRRDRRLHPLDLGAGACLRAGRPATSSRRTPNGRDPMRSAAIAFKSRPTLKCGPFAAMTTARTSGSAAQLGHRSRAAPTRRPAPSRFSPLGGRATGSPPRRRVRCSGPGSSWRKPYGLPVASRPGRAASARCGSTGPERVRWRRPGSPDDLGHPTNEEPTF